MSVELESIETMTERLVRERLTHFHWNILRTAESLGVDRRTVYRMMSRFNLERPPEAISESENVT